MPDFSCEQNVQTLRQFEAFQIYNCFFVSKKFLFLSLGICLFIRNLGLGSQAEVIFDTRNFISSSSILNALKEELIYFKRLHLTPKKRFTSTHNDFKTFVSGKTVLPLKTDADNYKWFLSFSI